MVLFRHNLPQPAEVQLMRGEFHRTLCIEQGVVLSLQVFRVGGSMDFSGALDGSRESVK